MLGIQLAPQLAQHRGQDAGGRAGPRAVDGVPVALGVLRLLRQALLGHAGPVAHVPEFTARQRAVLERPEQGEDLRVRVSHHRGVQEQHRPARAGRAVVQRDVRQAGGGDHRLDARIEPGQHAVQPGEHPTVSPSRKVQVSCHIAGGAG